MSNTDLARALILGVARQLEAEGKNTMAATLRHAETLTYRRSPVRRAPSHSNPITTELAAQIREMAEEQPTMHTSEIAAHFGVNPGRVSEILQGDR